MPPLTASFRRALLTLFVFMAFVITLIYWNQSSEKPASASFSNVFASSLFSNNEKYDKLNINYLKHNDIVR